MGHNLGNPDQHILFGLGLGKSNQPHDKACNDQTYQFFHGIRPFLKNNYTDRRFSGHPTLKIFITDTGCLFYTGASKKQGTNPHSLKPTALHHKVVFSFPSRPHKTGNICLVSIFQISVKMFERI
jgi:hypothetical protein